LATATRWFVLSPLRTRDTVPLQYYTRRNSAPALKHHEPPPACCGLT